MKPRWIEYHPGFEYSFSSANYECLTCDATSWHHRKQVRAVSKPQRSRAQAQQPRTMPTLHCQLPETSTDLALNQPYRLPPTPAIRSAGSLSVQELISESEESKMLIAAASTPPLL